MFYFKIALKSILNRHQQYKSLFAVTAVGICIMLSALMITDGMIKSMNEKARQYYGGDVQFLGGLHLTKSLEQAHKEAALLKQNLKNDNVLVIERFNHDGSKDSYYFEGTSVKQRAIIGVNFEEEKELFSKFTFVEGSYEKGEYEDTVLLSEPIAKKLGCHVGDSVTYYCPTDNGINTTQLVLTGIFQDASVFGMYTSYVNYSSLMTALCREPQIDRISIYYKNGEPSNRQLLKLYSELSDTFNMYPFGIDKQDFYDDYSKLNGVEKYCLIPLSSNVTDLKLVISALQLIVAAIVLMLMIIISVGISSTYRVIVIKRNVESGTLRAIGMRPSGVMKMFVAEAFLLLISGALTGFAASFIIVNVIAKFNLSFVSGFDLFLTGGCLIPGINGLKITGLVTVIIVTTLCSVLFTLRKLVHVSPVTAMATTT